MTPSEIETLITELTESMMNGNTSVVVQTINALPVRAATAVVARLVYVAPPALALDIARLIHALARDAE